MNFQITSQGIYEDWTSSEAKEELSKLQQIVQHILPSVLSRLAELENKNCVGNGIKTEKPENEKNVSSQENDGRRRVTSTKPRELVMELKKCEQSALQLYRDVEKMNADPCALSRQRQSVIISGKRHNLKEVGDYLCQRNMEVNGTDDAEYLHNQLRYINTLELILSLPVFKGFEHETPWNCDRSWMSYETLRDTSELMEHVCLEMRQLAQCMPKLKSWISLTTQSSLVTPTEEVAVRECLRNVNNVETIVTDEFETRKKSIGLRAAMAQRAFLLSPSVGRMKDLQGYDRLRAQ